MLKTLFLAAALSAFAMHATTGGAESLEDHSKGPQEAPERWNTPEWVLTLVEKKQFDKKYRLSHHLNPYYLRGDFNGDGRADIAVLVERLADGKQGIAIFHAGESLIRVVGAGFPLGPGGDDFSWMDVWQVYPKGPVEQGVEEADPPTLRGEALWVEKSESASAIIYWDGKKYAWYHQGD